MRTGTLRLYMLPVTDALPLALGRIRCRQRVRDREAAFLQGVFSSAKLSWRTKFPFRSRLHHCLRAWMTRCMYGQTSSRNFFFFQSQLSYLRKSHLP